MSNIQKNIYLKNKIKFISEYSHILIYALQDRFGSKLENDYCIKHLLSKSMEELEDLRKLGIEKLSNNSPLQKLKNAVRDSEETRKQLFGLTNK